MRGVRPKARNRHKKEKADMQTAIDFGKDFLENYYHKQDAEACLTYLADDIVWIAPDEVSHFRTSKEILEYLKKSTEKMKPSNVDIMSIKSPPCSEETVSVAYEINVIPKDESKGQYLRVSFSVRRSAVSQEINFLHISDREEEIGLTQMGAFAGKLDCGLLIVQRMRGGVDRSLYCNHYFAKKMSMTAKDVDDRARNNPLFMLSYDEQKKIREAMTEAVKGGKKDFHIDVTIRTEKGKTFPHRLSGSHISGGERGGVFYMLFQDTASLQKKITSLEQMNRTLQKQSVQIAGEYKNLEQEWKKVRTDADDSADRVKTSYEEQIRSQQKESEERMRAMQEEFDEKYRLQRIRYEKEISDTEGAYKSKLWLAEGAYRREMDSRDEEHKAAIARLQKELEETKADSAAQIESAKKLADAQVESARALADAQAENARNEAEARVQAAEKAAQETAEAAKAQAEETLREREKKIKADISAVYEQGLQNARKREMELAKEISAVRAKSGEYEKEILKRTQAEEVAYDQIAALQRELLNRQEEMTALQEQRKEQDSVMRISRTSRAESSAESEKALRRLERAMDIKGSAQLMRDMIGEARLLIGGRSPSAEPFRFGDCMDTVARMMREYCRQRKLSFRYDETDADKLYSGDKAMLQYVLLSILEYAAAMDAASPQAAGTDSGEIREQPGLTLSCRADRPVRDRVYLYFTVNDPLGGIRQAADFANNGMTRCREMLGMMGGGIRIQDRKDPASAQGGNGAVAVITVALGRIS